MNTANNEVNIMERWSSRLSLPPGWKRYGVMLFALAVISVIILRIAGVYPDFGKLIFGQVILVSLLIISISRERVEDEMIINLRMKSYALAFILGVIYALIQPYVNWMVGSVIREDVVFEALSGLQVLSFMLLVQIGFFHAQKRQFA